jgi:hypothetical protein
MISHQIAPMPVKAVDPPTSGNDTAGFGIGQDGQTYVIKSPLVHPLLPATEAFCEVLAHACQLPATVGAWLDVNGVSCYGSKFEGGLEKALPAQGSKLVMESRKRQWQRCTNPGIATATFALDLFVFNYDRHHNNWAFQDQNGNRTARIYDFSRSWWTCAKDVSKLPPPGEMKLLPPKSERTCRDYATVKSWVGEDLLAAGNVLDLLTQINTAWVEKRILELPAGWVDKITLDATLAWWDSPLKNARVDAIRKGLNDATLL